jgi:hypothetical protein
MLASHSTKTITPAKPKPRPKGIIATFTRWHKRKTSNEKRANLKMQGAKKERPLINKKEATPKHKGLKKERHPMKKKTTPKRKELKRKTADGKRGNPKIQGAKTEDLR